MPKKELLVVDDEAAICDVLRAFFTTKGFHVATAPTRQAALQQIQETGAEVVLLDLNLPDGSGLDLCREIRADKTLSLTPVIMLTGQGRIDDKGSGFEAGADQYLIKPVQPRELLMWVSALLRRLKLDAGEADVIEAGDLAIDVKSHLVRFKDQTISNLTVKEFELLFHLVRKRPQVLTRKHIIYNLWRSVTVDNVVDTHIHNLRKKVQPELALRLQSVPGKGFRYLG